YPPGFPRELPKGMVFVQRPGSSLKDLSPGKALPAATFQLRAAWLMERTVTDADLRHLQRLNGLLILDLRHTKTGDEALRSIGEIKSLRGLLLNRCPITDEGLRSLNALVDLESLYLDGTGITGSGFAALKNLAKLQLLAVPATKIADESMRTI